MRLPGQSSAGVRRLYQRFLGTLPGESMLLGDGLTRADFKALEKLAAKDVYRIVCVGYTGLLEWQLVGPGRPLD